MMTAHEVAMARVALLIADLGAMDTKADLGHGAVVQSVRAFQTALIVAEGERVRVAEMISKHQSLVVQCRDARDRYEQIGRDLEKAEASYWSADDKMQNREQQLSEFLGQPRDPLASAQEKREWARQREELEKNLELARVQVREANGLRMSLHKAQLDASKEHERLSFAERNTRPPVVPERDTSIGGNGLRTLSSGGIRVA